MKKNNLITLVLAVLLAVCCFIPILFMKQSGREQYDVLYFGDSIIAGWGNEIPVPDRLAQQSGFKVYNAAFGGMTLSDSVNIEYMTNMYSVFSMVGLSDCVRDRDFSMASVSSRRENDAIAPYWVERAEGLLNINLDSVKYVIVEQGINDYMLGTDLDNPDNPYDTETYGGALRYVIRNIKKGMPNATIIVETPIFSATMGNSDNVNTGSGTLPDYIALAKEIALEEDVELFDAHELTGINQTNFSQYLYDNLHTNSLGDELLAGCLNDFINTLE